MLSLACAQPADLALLAGVSETSDILDAEAGTAGAHQGVARGPRAPMPQARAAEAVARAGPRFPASRTATRRRRLRLRAAARRVPRLAAAAPARTARATRWRCRSCRARASRSSSAPGRRAMPWTAACGASPSPRPTSPRWSPTSCSCRCWPSTAAGWRLGYGGGFYDRTLRGLRARKADRRRRPRLRRAARSTPCRISTMTSASTGCCARRARSGA